MNAEEIKKQALEKVNIFFSNLISQEEKDALKEYIKLSDTPAPGTPDPNPAPTNKEVKTKDGKKLSVEGELKVDAVIKEITPEGSVELADGDYVLVDEAGTELPIKVAGGKITEITAAATPDPNQEMAQQVATLSTQLSEQKTANEKLVTDLKTELAEVKKQSVETAKILIKILEAPVNLSTPKVEKKFEEMTNPEKVRFNRGEKIYK